MTAPFLTNAGLAKLLAASPENPVKVKYLAADIANGTPSPSMTQLFNEVHRVEIPNPVRSSDDPATLVFTGTIPESVGGWTIYGFGLFSDANELLAYWQLETPIVKPPADSALKMAISPDMYLKLSNAAQTELIVTASTLFRHNATTERDAADCHPISSITGLYEAIDGLVKIRGDQSIAGVKKFTDRIETMHVKAADGSGDIYLANGMIDFGTMKMIGDGSGIFPATTARAGVAEIATTQEARSATNDTDIVTPKKLRDALNASGDAHIFACRAWVVFNGIDGTIFGSGNVASITDNADGDYTINFSIPMPNENYAVSALTSRGSGGWVMEQDRTASSLQIIGQSSASRISVMIVG